MKQLMTVLIIVRIAIWATFILLIIDGVLLTIILPHEIRSLKVRVKVIEDWIREHVHVDPH